MLNEKAKFVRTNFKRWLDKSFKKLLLLKTSLPTEKINDRTIDRKTDR